MGKTKWLLVALLCFSMVFVGCDCSCSKKKKKKTPPTLTITAGPNQPTTGTVPSGSTNVPILQFTVSANSVSNLNILSIVFQASGSGNDATMVTAVKLWRDADSNGTVTTGDTQINGNQTYVTDNGTVTFSGSPLRTINAGQSEVWLLTYDFVPTASGTFSATIASITAQTPAGGNAKTTGLSTPLSPTITTDPTGPVVVSAELQDTNSNGNGDPGEKIIVTFNRDLVVNGVSAANDFQLPVTNDSFGSGATYALGTTANQIVITLAAGCVITGKGTFNSANLTPGSPSGIDVKSPLSANAIEDTYGRDAQASTPVDIFTPFVPGTGTPATGLELNALDPAGQQSGNVIIQYIVAYANNTTNLTLTVEYYDGTTWKTATAATGSDALTFTASSRGDLRIFYWKSYTDMPNAGASTDYDIASLKFTLSDGTNSVSDTVSVKLDNKPQAVVIPPNQVVNVGEIATISAKNSFDPNPAAGSLSYTWTAGTFPSGSGASFTTIDYLATITPDLEGDYPVTLTVSKGGRTSDPLNLNLKAVKTTNYVGKIHLGNFGVGGASDFTPLMLGLLPASDIGAYGFQYNGIGFLNLAATSNPPVNLTAHSTPYLGWYATGGGTDYVFCGDVFGAGAPSNRFVSAWADYGTGSTTAYAGVINFTTTPAAGAGGFWNVTGTAVARAISCIRRQYTGSGGTSTTDEVAYVGYNGILLEVGSINPDNPAQPRLLSYASNINVQAGGIGIYAPGGTPTSLYVSCSTNPATGVHTIPITTVGTGSGSDGLNTATATLVSNWPANAVPRGIYIDNTNGFAYVAYSQTNADGGLAVINCTTKTVVLNYVVADPAVNSAPFQIEVIPADKVVLLTDPTNGKVYLIKVNNMANPTSCYLEYTFNLQGAYDVEYDDGGGRNRVLVTGSTTGDIYVLKGPWEFEWKIVDGSAANPANAFKFAIDPTNGNLCIVYSTGGDGIYFNRSTDGGLTWGTAVQVVASGSNPDFAIDSQGHIIVAYDDGDEIFIKRSTDGGATFSAASEVISENADQTLQRTKPSIVLDAVDNIIVAYEVVVSGETRVAVVKSVPHQNWLYWGYAGSTPVDNYVDDTAPGNATSADIVIVDGTNPLDRVAVVWTDGRNPSTDIYSDSAVNAGWLPTFGTDTNMSNMVAGNNASAPSASVDSNGALICAYQVSGGTSAIQFGASTIVDNATGTTRTSPHLVSVGTGSQTHYIVYVVDGKFVYLRKSEDDGASWSAASMISLYDSTKSKPQIATNRSASRMVGWLDERAGGGDVDVYFTRWK
ncbi:MAG: hypothetical protein N2234_03230 [Planctomycetota bacterium]|nr:hypothetical protein [Planctomycetota bacterium]